MSQENVEVVRTMWDAFLRRDFDKALSGQMLLDLEELAVSTVRLTTSRMS